MGDSAPEHRSPAEHAAEIAADRGCECRRDRLAAVHKCKSPRHVALGNQPHDDGGGQRPESADADAEQGAAYHEDREIRSGRHQNQREEHERRHGDQDPFSVERSGGGSDEHARGHREEAADRNRLPGLAFGCMKTFGHRRQQADRHELGGDQHGHAECHGEHRAPCGLGLHHSVVVCSVYHRHSSQRHRPAFRTAVLRCSIVLIDCPDYPREFAWTYRLTP